MVVEIYCYNSGCTWDEYMEFLELISLLQTCAINLDVTIYKVI